jgi:anti-sigma regulatory factor (Ser/Thr protein kinase)
MPIQTFLAHFESLDAIRDFVGDAANQAGLGEKDVYSVQLATDEAASNIIEHAYEGVANGQIEISTEITKTSLQIILRDHGKPFDPQTVAEPDIHAALEERIVGGLGLFFMRKLMDEVRFEYLPEMGNVLTMLKYLPATQKPPDVNPSK